MRLRDRLQVGMVVTLTAAQPAYGHRFTVPAGTPGFVGAVQVPCVYYGSGFPGDEFACVDVLLRLSDLSEAQRAELVEHAPYRQGEVPQGWVESVFARPQLRGEGGDGYSLFRVAAPYDGMRVRATHPLAGALCRELWDAPPPEGVCTSYPYPWMRGWTHAQALAHLAGLSGDDVLMRSFVEMQQPA